MTVKCVCKIALLINLMHERLSPWHEIRWHSVAKRMFWLGSELVHASSIIVHSETGQIMDVRLASIDPETLKSIPMTHYVRRAQDVLNGGKRTDSGDIVMPKREEGESNTNLRGPSPVWEASKWMPREYEETLLKDQMWRMAKARLDADPARAMPVFPHLLSGRHVQAVAASDLEAGDVVSLKPKQYRQFANGEEFTPHRNRWWRSKKDACVFYPPQPYSEQCHNGVPWGVRFENCVFDDGSPFGVEVSE
jgi:hypothetical protein